MNNLNTEIEQFWQDQLVATTFDRIDRAQSYAEENGAFQQVFDLIEEMSYQTFEELYSKNDLYSVIGILDAIKAIKDYRDSVDFDGRTGRTDISNPRIYAELQLDHALAEFARNNNIDLAENAGNVVKLADFRAKLVQTGSV
jgi:hypothetical protein